MVDVQEPVASLIQSAVDAPFTIFSYITMPELTLTNLIRIGSASAMIFGGIPPFIPQYRDIRRTKNAEGFSTFVCLNLLIANILRIMFWFGKHFELPLLAQSIIMTFIMLIMVHLCVSVKHKTEIIKAKEQKFSATEMQDTVSFRRSPSFTNHRFTDFDLEYFWKWTDFSSYIEFTLAFTGVIGLLTYIFLNNWVFIETLGFLAVFAEAMLGAPQFYRNFQNKSTQGMSKKMVAMWTCGDVFKTCYFILRAAPAQFWICGMLQVSIDISIFIQVFVYRNLVPKPGIH